MASTMSAFISVAPNKIEATLSKIIGQNGELPKYSVGLAGNLVLCSSGKWSDQEIDECISSLEVPHSCRFFIVSPGGGEFQTAVTARCRKIAGDEHVCTEIIKICFPLSETNRALSVLRSNFLPGVESELLLFDDLLDRDVLHSIFRIVDKALIDSSEYAKRFLFVKGLLRIREGIVDAAWLRLLPWREAIKDGTRFKDWSKLTEIRLTYETSGPPVEPLLLLSWLLLQLQLDVISCTANGYETRGDRVIPVKMRVDQRASVAFLFSDSTPIELSCPELERSKVALFARYYHHRPRLTEYPNIVRLALDLELMRQSFGTDWR